jgi:Alpha/beta hydrolase domain
MTTPACLHRGNATVTVLPGRSAHSAAEPRIFDGQRVPVLEPRYVETEYLLTATADTYSGPITGPVTVDRREVPYCTRILVRRPVDPDEFSGRVLTEPFNTTYGDDRDLLWAHVGDLLQSNGDAWVGVSVRQLSVEGLRRADAGRYAALSVEGNDLAWDILATVGALLRGRQHPLTEAAARHVYLAGYSQSALDTATFAVLSSACADLGGRVFDGYLPIAHAASFTAVSGPEGIPGRDDSAMPPVGVPVIDVQPQSDVEGFTVELGDHRLIIAGSASVRREDSDTPTDRYRLFELPGAPHARCVDGCDGIESDFPTMVFVRSALHHLYRWAEQGIVPPRAPRITLAHEGPVSVAAVDDTGNPIGGIRAPQLEVPLARYAVHSTPGPLGALVGAITPLPLPQLLTRYRDGAGYLRQFAAALARTVQAGFILPDDAGPMMVAAAAAARTSFDPHHRPARGSE